MIESFVDIDTPDGTMGTFVVRPDEGGPFPVVLFLMDAPGMREELRDMSRRLASTGYFVLAPQLYYRDVDEFNLFDAAGDPAAMEQARARMFELMHRLSNAMVVSDARAAIDHAATQPDADATRVGTVGYCMSGPFTIAIAAALADVVEAAASIHGVRLAVDADDSPHTMLDDVAAEIYVACAEFDEYAPPEMIERFEAALIDSSASGRIEWYPGTEHGFAFPGRGPLYDKAAAERHWCRLHSLFARTLH